MSTMAVRCADIHGGGSMQLGVLTFQGTENRGGMAGILEVTLAHGMVTPMLESFFPHLG